MISIFLSLYIFRYNCNCGSRSPMLCFLLCWDFVPT